MKVTDRLRQLIFKQLYKELGNVEIIPTQYSYWFINREEKYWYFQLTESGCLYWRYDYFKSFFSFFSLESKDFEPIISSWVEEVLNSKVSTTIVQMHHKKDSVEEVLNSKVSTTAGKAGTVTIAVEQVLNRKVSKTVRDVGEGNFLVEDILNRKVSKTEEFISRRAESVYEALNNKKENESN